MTKQSLVPSLMSVLICGLVLGASTATAQVKANASIGFSTHDRVFNQDADRVDAGVAGTSLTATDVVIQLGAAYDIWMGLYAGADLTIVNRSLTSTTGSVETQRKRFDIRELHINVGYAADLAVLVLDVGMGVKIDLGKQDDLSSTEIPVSDGHHAFKAHISALASLGLVSLGGRVGIVVPFDRETSASSGGISTAFTAERGVVVDPALVTKFGFGIVSVGVDLGFLYHAEDGSNGVVQPDTDFYVLHVIPSIGFNFGGHEITFALGFQDEDYMLGVPLVGKNHKAPESPPMSLSWKGNF